MIQAILGIIPGMLKLGSELIEDPDKKIEYAFKSQELVTQIVTKLISTPTVPWVDALVKVIFAFDTLFKGSLRPVGSACLAAFAAYCDTHNIELSEPVKFLLYGAPAAWGYSRHVEKKEKAKTEANPMEWYK